jgi:hypothetical protein
MKRLILILCLCVLGCATERDSTPSPVVLDVASSQISSSWTPSNLFTNPPACYEQCGDQLCWVCGDPATGAGDAWWDQDIPSWMPPRINSPVGNGDECDDFPTPPGDECVFLTWKSATQCEMDYCSSGTYSRTGVRFNWDWEITVCSEGWSCTVVRPVYREPVEGGTICGAESCFAPPPPPPPPLPPPPALPPPPIGGDGPCHGSRCPVEQGDPDSHASEWEPVTAEVYEEDGR